MDQPVKAAPGRRQRKAQATRRRVLDAAETLFVRDGYAATAIIAIAEQADVAAATVYALFGTKRSILTELLAARVTGDDEPAPLRARPQWRDLEAEPDPRRQIALLAAIATDIGSRVAALYDVLAAAAAADPELAGGYQRQQQARYADQRRLARALARRGALRAGLTEIHATDVMWTLASPQTYRSLVLDRGWSADDYRRWLAGALTCSLLDVYGGAHDP
jgi:AcrR family transcriptional regulator